MATSKKADAAPENVVTTSQVGTARVPAGVSIVPKRDDPTLDPELEKAREADRKKLDAVKVDTSRPDPSIDDELVAKRDAEVKAAKNYKR